MVNALGGGRIELSASGVGMAVAIPCYALAMDGEEYLFHQAQHQIPLLWAMHSLHVAGGWDNFFMRNKILSSAIKIIANVVVVVGFGLMAYACYRKYRDTGSINWFGLLIVNSLFVAMYVARRDATSISSSPWLWVLAFAGTCVPLLMRPTAPAGWALAGNMVQIAGLCAAAGSMLSLRRSFGIVPAHRGIRTQGLYNLVRHPLYASELLAMLGFVIANPNWWNITFWICDCVLQFTRACAEERFLSIDPLYAQYRARVKYRLIPLVI
jgi:protein-S-isoprenylcysteine O-methyltransferase Ste14